MDKTHVPYPGCYCADCVESWPGGQAAEVLADFRAAFSNRDESAWLIERRVSPPQWSVEERPTGVGAFFSDVHRAYRFQTRDAAESAMRQMCITPEERREYFVSEHMWIATPSARITGDKDRLVQSRALTDLTTRLHSFAKALETGFDFNVMKHLDVSMCCDGRMCGCQGSTVGQYLAHQLRGELPEENQTEGNRQLAIEAHRLRSALRWIADTGYVDQQSGNQNFEHLQSIARDALTKEPTR